MLVDVDTKSFAAVEQMVTGSWKQNFEGHEHDSDGLTHSNIQVERVQRIEDPYTYQRYRNRLTRACQEALQCDYPAITSMDNEPEVLTATLNIPELEAIRLREVNEYFLFRPVPNAKLENVVRGKLVRSGLFHTALHMSESSTQVDQHAGRQSLKC